MSYSGFTTAGVVLALVAARSVPADDATPATVAVRVRVAALVGGIGGAYLAASPARIYGLSPAGEHATWLGRTVLGGLLVGWACVELMKTWLGYREPTGDRFAVPLAIGLAVGRLGCVRAGCCLGVRVDPESLAGRVGTLVGGVSRFPATLMEAYFHGLAALVLVALHLTRRLKGARLAGYMAAYGIVRFLLEWKREAPPFVLGLTYYQVLALALFGLAGSTFVRRARPTALTAQP